MAKFNDEEFLAYIVKALVDNKDDVKIERKVDEMGVLLSLRVHRDDMGQVVGRAGSTIKAIRTLIRIIGVKNHARVNLRVEEPEGGSRERSPFQETKAKDKKEISEKDIEDLKI